MKRWLGVIAGFIAFALSMYYLLINDENVFYIAIGVMAFTVGNVTYGFSVSSYKLKNYNILTRYGPSIFAASVFILLHSLSDAWSGNVVVDQDLSSDYFLVLAVLFLTIGLLIGFINLGKKYNHTASFWRNAMFSVFFGSLVLWEDFSIFVTGNVVFHAVLAVSLVVMLGTTAYGERNRDYIKNDIWYVRVITMLFSLGILFILLPESMMTHYFQNIFLTAGFVFSAYEVVSKNVRGTLFERHNYYSAQIEDLELNNQNLRESEAIFRSLYEDAPIGYQSMDENGDLLYVNNSYAEMLGYSAKDMIGKHFTSLMTPQSKEKMPLRFDQFKLNGEIETVFDLIRSNGNEIKVKFIGKIAHNPDGSFRRTHCILMDISDDVEYQNELISSRERISSIIEATAEGIIGTNLKGEVHFINKKGLELLHLTLDEALNESIYSLFHAHEANDETCVDCVIKKMIASNTLHTVDNEKIHRKDGTWFVADISSYPQTHNEDKSGTVFTFKDITSKQELSMSLLKMSYHDHLTGLYNRRYFEKEMVVLDKSENYPLTIVNSDINGLKLINDAFGHSVGDELLVHAANVLRKNVSSTDLVARIGGDEFVILMPNTSPELAEEKIRKIQQEATKITVNFIELSISFGYATKRDFNEDIDEIYKQAEDAMYREKLLRMPSMRSSAINTVLQTLYEKDQYSESHSRRVSKISANIAKAMNLSSPEVQLVETAGLLHDIGKIVIPTEIITKEGRLTDEEYAIVKKHSEIGFRILSSADNMSDIAKIILSHHEWVNGEGYPRGIKDEEIPLLSKIICVADAFDAMTSERTYRDELSDDEALAELVRCAGTQFDLKVVKAFSKNFDKVRKDV